MDETSKAAVAEAVGVPRTSFEWAGAAAMADAQRRGLTPREYALAALAACFPPTYEQVAPILAAAETPPKVSAKDPCQHCGAEVYTGLFSRICPAGHDLSAPRAVPEPDIYEVWARRAWQGHRRERFPGAERVYQAIHPHYSANVTHPTRDGAIAAWRKAVGL